MATMGKKQDKKAGRKSPFSEQARADAVQLMRRGDVSQAQVAADLGVAPRTLQRWAAEFDRMEAATPLTADERKELNELRKTTERQAEEIVILKKFRAFTSKRRS